MTQQIWLGILESERLYRYYDALATKMRKQQLFWDALMVVFAGGIVVTLTTAILEGSAQGIGLVLLTSIIASIATWQQLRGWAVKATAARMMAAQFYALGQDWRRQWFREDDEVAVELLSARIMSIASQYDLPYDDKVNTLAQVMADEAVLSELKPAA